LPQGVQEAKVVSFACDTDKLLSEKDLTSLKGKIVNVTKQLENWFLTNNLIINTKRPKGYNFREEDQV
jgi:hypothetical protein